MHNEHNKPKRSGSLLLIILGAILFMIGPTQYQNSPELGILALVSGFILGGIGFYLKYVKGKIIR
uniref:Uncharacterized protein n=1 Tax=uncultured marine thaumarchaeote SAT1000_18_D03 TaxID=1456391 RepID=A0A075ICA3_9ARCH|nr:hypothetical protein [uncultured marine thaumarchaeote SAT1000_18_D03]